MKTTMRTTVVLFFAMIVLAAAPGTVWADNCNTGNGIMLGTNALTQDFAWHFSLINLTGSNIVIGAKNSTDHDLSSNFPYGAVYPPGNSANSKTKGTSGATTLNLTTWKSNEKNQMFPDHCTTTVNFEISSNTAYNFSLRFNQKNNQRQAMVTLQPPYGKTSWKYSTDIDAGNGYHAYPPQAPNDDGLNGDEGDGILFAISDRYVLTLYKNNMEGQGGNSLNLVVTERDPSLDYHGNKLRWIF